MKLDRHKALLQNICDLGRVSGRLISFEELPSDWDVENYQAGCDDEALRALLKTIRLPAKRSYPLGIVSTGVALMESSASHRVVRRNRGKSWRLYVSGADFAEGEELIGEFSANEIVDEVADLGYEISLGTWVSMGWRL